MQLLATLNQARVCAPLWDPKQHAVHGAGKANCEAHSLHNRRTKSKVETFLISSGENHRLIAATLVEIRAVAVAVLTIQPVAYCGAVQGSGFRVQGSAKRPPSNLWRTDLT